MRRVTLLAAAFLAAAILFLLATLPPQPVRTSLDGVDADLRRRTIAGGYHIHTTRSDGAQSKAAVAAAAARAGLAFAIFTDHGDGTRTPDAPSYLEGVLCIDGVEISTNGGHYVALGLPPSPYPLGGDAAAVVEDVARLGGFGIAAHPEHPKTGLAWTDSTAPVDGIEWINADAEWRDERALALAQGLFGYLLRPGPAMSSMLDRPERTLARWDAISRARSVIALAAIDAHGGAGEDEPANNDARLIAIPSYESSFRTLSNRVILERPLTGDAIADARLLLDAIRQGMVYSVVDGLSPDVLVAMDPRSPGPRSPLPAGAQVSTVRDGDNHRIEIQLPQAPGRPPVPWVLTNWIRASDPPALPAVRSPLPASIAALGTKAWRVESDAGSSGRVSAASGSVTLHYALREGGRQSQYVAAVTDLSLLSNFSALIFDLGAARPMRVSVQLRFPPDDSRWVKSVYVGPGQQQVVVQGSEMTATDTPGRPMPPPETARSLLFVVDLVNAKPGDTGAFTITGLRTVR